MDNVTHALAGLLTGELVTRSKASTRGRTLLLFTGIAASNFPDLDLLLTPLIPQPLGYLLMHRGHTHTLLFLLPQALLLTLGIWALWPRAREMLRKDRAVRRAYVVTLFVGLGLHLGMDLMNSYGVHPFYPFDSSWYFGDAVFIVEPLLWATLAAGVVAAMASEWVRRAWTAVIVGVPLMAAAFGLIPMVSWVLVVVIYFGLGFVERRTRRGVVISALASTLLVLGQAALSSRAKAVARAGATGDVVDIASSPLAGNPLCWMTQSIARIGDDYEIRSAVISLLPSLIHPTRCSPRLAPEEERRARGSLTELRRRARADCRFDAWLRFARMPMISGDQVADVRFASGARGNFTAMGLGDEVTCPWVPGWARPRQDLLDR